MVSKDAHTLFSFIVNFHFKMFVDNDPYWKAHLHCKRILEINVSVRILQ